ncbi:MAG: glycosyltransferase [Bacteroidota bacterium]|nr:glycosyltransferase [Bacteroidota bacterium]
MKKNIVLSYVITTYNKIQYLKYIIDEVLLNIKNDEEIVVIDGGSEDGTIQYLEDLYISGKIHKYISEKDCGESHGLNKGLLLAEGELIKLLSDDDAFYFPGIQICKKFMMANPEVEVMATNGASIVWDDDIPIVELGKVYESMFKEWEEFKKPMAFCGLGLLIRRQSLPKIGLFNIHYVRVDAEFSLRLTSLPVKIAWYTGYTWVRFTNISSNSIKYERNIALETQQLNGYYKVQIDGDNNDKVLIQNETRSNNIGVKKQLNLSLKEIKNKGLSCQEISHAYVIMKNWLQEQNRTYQNKILFDKKNINIDKYNAEILPNDFSYETTDNGTLYERIIRKCKEKNIYSVNLHLGCGEMYFSDYVNIDYPSDKHNVMNVKPDIEIDLLDMELPANAIDEIRLHHVYEHFNRVTALSLLIKWHKWLKLGGKLHIETPDLIGSAKTLLSDMPLKIKMGVVRHLAGDQAASWAYHIDHWFAERFEHTLGLLGFGKIKVNNSTWKVEPFLSNVEVIAEKTCELSTEEMLLSADKILWESTVSDREKKVYEVWRKQLRDVLTGSNHEDLGIAGISNIKETIACSKTIENNISQNNTIPLSEIHDFNQMNRNKWVIEKAKTINAGSKVLDVGAGTCPYKYLFNHCDYKTHDFKKYEGVKLNGEQDYGKIDYVSDIVNIPIEDNSFDVILCTEVLEHVPEPAKALEEMSRLLRPGGRLLITAPLGSGLHQLPYHYYGGYTPEWYKHFGEKFGLNVVEITPNGGFFKLLSQETARFVWTLPKHRHLHGESEENLKKLFGELLPRFLYELDEKCMIDQFTVGYHVEFIKGKPIHTSDGCNKEQVSSKEKANEYASTNKMDLAKHRTKGVIFSKNRALQLDALLRSFYLNCLDPENIELIVIYKADDKYINQYKLLEETYQNVVFVKELDFKVQLLEAVLDSKYLMFLVDDNVFIRDFCISQLCDKLEQIPNALGFSLRLGENTIYCYPKNSSQELPKFNRLDNNVLLFNWTSSQLDFNYPLELSSSLYRTDEVIPIISKANYKNPNSLEGIFDEVKQYYKDQRPMLLCARTSLAFCIPVNKVQREIANRSGNNNYYSIDALASIFEDGKRIDVSAMKNFVPNACHQEIEYSFTDCKSEELGDIEHLILKSQEMIENGNNIKAIETLEKLLLHHPKDIKILTNLAVANYLLNENNVAIKYLARVLEIDPKNKIANENLAMIKDRYKSSHKNLDTQITIFTAAYNAEKYISQTINSVLNQTFKDFEYIIVDDGSSDNTAAIIESHKDKRIKFYRLEHKNFASAMNYAIQKSNGRYILGIDSDDFVETDYLEKIYDAARKNPEADYVYPEYFTIIDEYNNIIEDKNKFEDFSGDRNQLLVRRLFNEATGRVPNPGSLKKREIYEKYGLYEELETIEDFVFLCNNSLKINFLRADGVKGYFYRSLQTGNSRKYLVRSKIMANALFKMVQKYPPEILFPEIKDILQSEKQKKYLDFLKSVFQKHAKFYQGRGGEYFEMYSNKITD